MCIGFYEFEISLPTPFGLFLYVFASEEFRRLLLCPYRGLHLPRCEKWPQIHSRQECDEVWLRGWGLVLSFPPSISPRLLVSFFILLSGQSLPPSPAKAPLPTEGHKLYPVSLSSHSSQEPLPWTPFLDHTNSNSPMPPPLLSKVTSWNYTCIANMPSSLGYGFHEDRHWVCACSACVPGAWHIVGPQWTFVA